MLGRTYGTELTQCTKYVPSSQNYIQKTNYPRVVSMLLKNIGEKIVDLLESNFEKK